MQTDSYIRDCERMIAQARLTQRHYPEAALRDLAPDERRVWCAEGARANATGVDILIGQDALGKPAAFFCAYHEIRERKGEDDEIRVRIYSDDWPRTVDGWDLAGRLTRDPDLFAAVLTALRRERT
jgi:hypothetical protein